MTSRCAFHLCGNGRLFVASVQRYIIPLFSRTAYLAPPHSLRSALLSPSRHLVAFSHSPIFVPSCGDTFQAVLIFSSLHSRTVLPIMTLSTWSLVFCNSISLFGGRTLLLQRVCIPTFSMTTSLKYEAYSLMAFEIPRRKARSNREMQPFYSFEAHQKWNAVLYSMSLISSVTEKYHGKRPYILIHAMQSLCDWNDSDTILW